MIGTWSCCTAPDPGLLISDRAELDPVFGVEHDRLVRPADHLSENHERFYLGQRL